MCKCAQSPPLCKHATMRNQYFFLCESFIHPDAQRNFTSDEALLHMHTYKKSALCRRWVPLLLPAAQCQQHPATEEMDFEEEAAANAPAAQPRRKRSLSALCCSSGASSVSQVQLWWRARAFLCGAGITVNRSFLINFFRRLLPGRGNVLKCSFLLFFCLYMFLGWFLKGTKL